MYQDDTSRILMHLSNEWKNEHNWCVFKAKNLTHMRKTLLFCKKFIHRAQTMRPPSWARRKATNVERKASSISSWQAIICKVDMILLWSLAHRAGCVLRILVSEHWRSDCNSNTRNRYRSTLTFSSSYLASAHLATSLIRSLLYMLLHPSTYLLSKPFFFGT